MNKAPAVIASLALAVQPLAGALPVHAQSAKQPAALTLAQTERNAVALRQGMSLEEVSSLLGKPRRTSLRDVSGSAAGSSHGLLQWLYSWDASDRGSLRIDFTPKTEGGWTVASWEWTTY